MIIQVDTSFSDVESSKESPDRTGQLLQRQMSLVSTDISDKADDDVAFIELLNERQRLRVFFGLTGAVAYLNFDVCVSFVQGFCRKASADQLIDSGSAREADCRTVYIFTDLIGFAVQLSNIYFFGFVTFQIYEYIAKYELCRSSSHLESYTPAPTTKQCNQNLIADMITFAIFLLQSVSTMIASTSICSRLRAKTQTVLCEAYLNSIEKSLHHVFMFVVLCNLIFGSSWFCATIFQPQYKFDIEKIYSFSLGHNTFLASDGMYHRRFFAFRR